MYFLTIGVVIGLMTSVPYLFSWSLLLLTPLSLLQNGEARQYTNLYFDNQNTLFLIHTSSSKNDLFHIIKKKSVAYLIFIFSKRN